MTDQDRWRPNTAESTPAARSRAMTARRTFASELASVAVGKTRQFPLPLSLP